MGCIAGNCAASGGLNQVIALRVKCSRAIWRATRITIPSQNAVTELGWSAAKGQVIKTAAITTAVGISIGPVGSNGNVIEECTCVIAVKKSAAIVVGRIIGNGNVGELSHAVFQIDSTTIFHRKVTVEGAASDGQVSIAVYRTAIKKCCPVVGKRTVGNRNGWRTRIHGRGNGAAAVAIGSVIRKRSFRDANVAIAGMNSAPTVGGG